MRLEGFGEVALVGKARPASLLIRTRGFGRLPAHNLPLAFALEEGAAVQILRDFNLPVLLSGGDEPKSNDCGVAVLLNANFFGGVSRLRVAGFWRRRRAHVAHDLSFAAPLSGRAGVDNIVGPEAFMHRDIVVRSAGEKIFQEPG